MASARLPGIRQASAGRGRAQHALTPEDAAAAERPRERGRELVPDQQVGQVMLDRLEASDGRPTARRTFA